MKTIYYDVLEHGDYHFLVAVSQKGLVFLDVASPELTNLRRYFRNEEIELVEEPEMLDSYLKQLREYFAGQRQTFEFALDLANYGTAFQQQVWQELVTIPFGESADYSMLATSVGRPKATRAVGTAVGKNPIPIVVPCHRILRKDGGLGGYVGGVELKRELLALEKVALK